MNIKQYIEYAKRVLNEDAGSEGLEYRLVAKSGLKSYKDEIMTIDDIKTEDGQTVGRVMFTYSHDYGFALNLIKDALKDIEIVSLSLVY